MAFLGNDVRKKEGDKGCKYKWVYVYVCVSVYTHTHTHTHTHSLTHSHTHTHIHIYTQPTRRIRACVRGVPFPVDVRRGLAAMTYGGNSPEADSTDDVRTGLLGCRCVDEPEFMLWCATAPYVQHVDDELVGLNASSGALVHKIAFPELYLGKLTSSNTTIRIMPLRWPRRCLATTEGRL
jgi:hypothetical protein